MDNIYNKTRQQVIPMDLKIQVGLIFRKTRSLHGIHICEAENKEATRYLPCLKVIDVTLGQLENSSWSEEEICFVGEHNDCTVTTKMLGVSSH